MATNIEALISSGGRNTATPEPQKPINSTERHLEMVRICQREFNKALGINRKVGEFLSYNPVLDQVNARLAQTEEQLQAVREDMDKELDTNLRERYRTARNVVKYMLDGSGRAFSEDDPNEPVDAKFQRGALYRIADGSPEAEREQQTVLVGTMAKRKLAQPETSLGSKVIVISPPGVVGNTAYTENFVNIYEAILDPKTGKKLILMTCFTSASSNENYREVIMRLRPDCSDISENAFDIWCLSNPIFIDSKLDPRTVEEIFNEEFTPYKEVTKEKDFGEIVERIFPFKQNYKDVVCSKTSTPKEIAIAFNAFLNKADSIRREIINKGKGIARNVYNLAGSMVRTFKDVKQEVEWWGKQIVEKVMAGCGTSGGFSIGEVSKGVSNLISNLISGIGAIGGFSKEKRGTCVICGEVNTCTKSCYKCGGMLR